MSTNQTIRQQIIDEDIPKLVKSLTGFNVRLFFLIFNYPSQDIYKKNQVIQDIYID